MHLALLSQVHMNVLYYIYWLLSEKWGDAL